MTITALLLVALLYTQAIFRASEFLVKTSISMQARQMAENKLGHVTVKLSPRQDELIQLGRLDGLDLTRSDWVHRQVEICPEFSKHVFVQYQKKGEPNEAFMAIYPLGEGKIYIVRQGNGPSPASRFSSTRASTITAFNAIISNEGGDSRLKAVTSDLDWIKLATCYAQLAGTPSATSQDDAGKFKQPNVGHGRISIVGIQVVGESGGRTNLSIEFSRRGFIRRVTRTESDKPPRTQ